MEACRRLHDHLPTAPTGGDEGYPSPIVDRHDQELVYRYIGPLRRCPEEGCPLSAGTRGVGCVLLVGARHDLTIGEQYSSTYMEVAIWGLGFFGGL